MANTAVFLLFVVFCTSSLSSARELPKECAHGPAIWCQSLKNAADCAAVGHCTATAWVQHKEITNPNEVSNKFIRMFRLLKDVKDLINEEYLSTKVRGACREINYPAIRNVCLSNTVNLEPYLQHVLASDATPETICRIIGMCNNAKLDHAVAISNKMTEDEKKPKDYLVGASKCTWGPSYWCSNFSTGRECQATKHCAERIWPKMKLPEDNDDICKICKDMVKQARDQLQSNETQEELKEVFEGSCKLIPVKIVAKDCMKLADEFVPELVETLASQMNPEMVCSVAGLCNNAKIDRMLDKYNNQLKLRKDCNKCEQTVKEIRKNFDSSTYEDFLIGMLKICRKTGPLADSCSMLVFKYYEDLLAMVKQELQPKGVCHLSGQCASKFHGHDEFTFPEEKNLTFSTKTEIPCEFCEQLIRHLRDVLVANTTEQEFYRVLKGLCKQTGKLKDECLQLVSNYYPVIYNYLVSDLKPKEICNMAGLCPKNIREPAVPISPLLPHDLIIKSIPLLTKIGNNAASEQVNSYMEIKPVTSDMQARDSIKVGRIAVVPKQTNVRVMGTEAPPADLPIERMFLTLPQGKNTCAFCQYFLHYIQVELSDATNEEAIKNAVENACNRLPNVVNDECKQFVSQYGAAVIAMLVQEMDPATVCPSMGLCPSTVEAPSIKINSDRSNCPLCLFAVEQLEAVLQNNRTEANIRHALDNLCTHLSPKLRTGCVDFVDAYSKQLVDMLVADMNAQEICVYLKLCKEDVVMPVKVVSTTSTTAISPLDKYMANPQLRNDRNNHKKPMLPKYMLDRKAFGDIETNEIPDNTVNGRPVNAANGQKTVCVICEFVMKEVEDQIKDKHNQDEIKTVVHNICKRMPKSVRAECEQFVDQYADLVISLLEQELEPSAVCQELKLCKPESNRLDKMDRIKEEILDCAVCETVVMAVKKVLSMDKVDHNIVHIVEKSCNLLPAKYYERCHTLMEIYGDSVIHLIEELGTKGVCQKIGLCAGHAGNYVRMHNDRRN